MIALEILYVALATVAVLVLLQVFAYIGTRLLYPPEPQIIYRNVPVQMPPQMQQAPAAPQVQSPFLQQSLPQQPLFPKNEPALTQPSQEVKLPEYEPRKPNSDSLQLDPVLPAGLQTVNPRDL
jgi:hypothetical protein